jgi:alkaline phosphatase D
MSASGAEQQTFTHAVASFEPTTTGVLLWTRVLGSTRVGWQVATDPDLRGVVASGEADVDPDRDHTVVVDVDGLQAATTYWYRFEAAGDRSPIGRTRTLPSDGADRFLLATVSCSRYSEAPFGVYRAVAERDVDLVVHLGDYIYEDGSTRPRRNDPPEPAITLRDYRRRLAQVRADPDTTALHLRHPVVGIWDDHDLADNAWRDGAKHHDPDVDGPWSDRAEAAARARQEWLPARLRAADQPLVTWRSMIVGDLAELLLLDTRLVGRDRQAGDEGSPDLDDPARSLLGDEQRSWLHERLADTERPWAVVASGVVVNAIELAWPRPLRWVNSLLPNGYAVLDGRLLHDDQWDGYPAERARLVDALRRRGAAGGRAVLLSGDVHSSWAFTGPCDEASGTAVAVEVTTPAVSSAAMGRAHYPGLWRVLDREANRLPHVGWADVTERGYATLDLTRDAAVAEWWFVHPYASDPSARTVPAAAFRSERSAWPPTFERVEPREVGAADPHRPGLPEALPPRPDDLGRLRLRRWVRLTAESTALALALIAPIAVVVSIARRSRARGLGGRGRG